MAIIAVILAMQRGTFHKQTIYIRLESTMISRVYIAITAYNSTGQETLEMPNPHNQRLIPCVPEICVASYSRRMFTLPEIRGLPDIRLRPRSMQIRLPKIETGLKFLSYEDTGCDGLMANNYD